MSFVVRSSSLSALTVLETTQVYSSCTYECTPISDFLLYCDTYNAYVYIMYIEP